MADSTDTADPPTTPWSWEDFYASMSPAQQRNSDKRMWVMHVEMAMMRHLPWLRWPLIRLATDFWTTLLDEGIYQTCKPRWGALTFAYLNDGMKPSLWHTLQEILGGPEYSMLYPAGAPKDKHEADNYTEVHRAWFSASKASDPLT